MIMMSIRTPSLLWLLFFLYECRSIQMDIEPDTGRCIGQELDQEDSVVFSFSAISLHKDSSDRKLTVKVMDPEEDKLYEEPLEIGGPQQDHSSVIQKRGQHYMCFDLAGGETAVRVVFKCDYKSKGLDPSKKVEKDNIPTLENQLKMAEGSLHLIRKELEFARRQEALMVEAGEINNSRIQWFSILSIIILLTISLWQILYLRSFFASKKLL